MANRILVVDDEKIIVKGIKFALERDGNEVEVAYDGETALSMAQSNSYDLIILDVMLPKMDGMMVCQNIREFSNVPIIMLTAKSEDMDKILGLDYGADDYMTKPFNVLELKARIRVILRRTQSAKPKAENTLSIHNLKIDFDSRTVWLSGEEINLTSREFDLLELMAKHAGTVYSREELLQLVWGHDSPGDVRTVDVHIRRLREKIEPKPSEPTFIQTRWGIGYFFKT